VGHSGRCVRAGLIQREAGGVHAVEQADAGAEQHGRERNRELVDQAAVQVLLDRLGAAGIFLPVYVLTIVPAPWVRRHRDQPQLKAFAQGATAAATGAIAGSVIVLGGRAIVDVPTALLALAALAILWRYKVPEPLVVAAAGALGLAIWVATHGAG